MGIYHKAAVWELAHSTYSNTQLSLEMETNGRSFQVLTDSEETRGHWYSDITIQDEPEKWNPSTFVKIYQGMDNQENEMERYQ